MKLHTESDDPGRRTELQTGFDLVRPHFSFRQDVRVLCFLAKGNDEELLSKLGRQNRGVHIRLAEYYDPYDARHRNSLKLPIATTDLLRDTSGSLNYDHLVYLHGSTTLHPVGCVMSLAHELQHVRQHEENQDLFSASERIQYEWTAVLKRKFINPPHEKDAMFASRRIAEMIYGRSKVSEYIAEQLDAATRLESPEAAYRESVIWNYQARWVETFSFKDEVESVSRQIQNS